MSGSLADKVVVVTGGASGIGSATCACAAASGAQVVLLDVDDRAATVAKGIGPAATSRAVDVSDASSVADAVAEVVAAQGRVDALVTCAGIVVASGVEDITAEHAARIFAVNVLGTLHAVQAALTAMPSGGAVVTVASVAAHRGGGLFGGSTYAASKAAVIGLTRGMAREVAHRGIRVNCVAPGPVDTPLLAGLDSDQRDRVLGSTLLGRFARAEEVAAAVCFLLSDAASYVTGETLNVNGGSHFG